MGLGATTGLAVPSIRLGRPRQMRAEGDPQMVAIEGIGYVAKAQEITLIVVRTLSNHNIWLVIFST